jgi:hypothetical protein
MAISWTMSFSAENPAELLSEPVTHQDVQDLVCIQSEITVLQSHGYVKG